MGAISGIFSFEPDHSPNRSVLEGMIDTVRHRGSGPSRLWTGARAGLASCGAGLLTNPTQTLAIAFSGQLFNRSELRTALASSDVRLSSDCDAGLALAVYETHGPSFVRRLNGQFALAIWSSRTASVLLARDALGICPLHYATAGGQLLFSSEAKGVLAHPGVRTESDDLAVAEAFVCGAVFGDRTMFSEVHCLEPGSTLTASAAGTRTDVYWRMPTSETGDADFDSFDVLQLEDLLQDSIQQRIGETGRWGVLLSGGTDSSALTTWACRLTPRVQTFSVDFATPWKGTETDAHYSGLVAERLGTHHRSFALDSEEYFSVLDDLAWYVERPYNKGAATMHLLARRLAPFATSVLSGEGMDEILAGYVGAPGLGLEDDLAGEVRCLPWAPYAATAVGLLTDDFRREFRVDELLSARLADALVEAPADPLNRKLYLYSTYFLRELIALHEQGSIAAGVETRFPYLDRRIVDLLAALPSSFKFRDGGTKAVFRKLVRTILPSEVLERRKTHLPMPHDPAAIARQLAFARELLCAPEARTARYFDRARLAGFLSGRRSDNSPHMLAVWQLSMLMITLELLHRRFRL